MNAPPRDLPYVTGSHPGVGGVLKSEPEDFVVDEVSAYEPSGAGDHQYLRIEKRDVAHEQMLDAVAARCGVTRETVGTAGMKDRRAVTRQWVSVLGTHDVSDGEEIAEGVRVLEVSRHVNRLKTGHVRSNHFDIRIRGAAQNDGESKLRAIFDALSGTGFPNYFGPQRFGHDGNTLATGRGLLDGSVKPKSIDPPRRKFLVRLAISAAQSWLFNETLADRIEDELLTAVVAGDVMGFFGSNSNFVAEDIEAEQRRLTAGETVVTGPMFGPKMRRPQADTAERERDVLRRNDLSFGHFAAFKSVAPGARRPMAVRPEFGRVDVEGDDLRLEMTLPAGSYATVVLREIMKED